MSKIKQLMEFDVAICLWVFIPKEFYIIFLTALCFYRSVDHLVKQH